MKLYQSDLEQIQKKLKKEYESEHIQYSNNAESEYVKIYDDDIIEEIILDLLKKVEELEREVEHKEEELEDIRQDVETNFRRIPIGEQVGITDKDFL